MKVKYCGTCRYWYEVEPTGARDGECRRRAPSNVDSEGRAIWPLIYEFGSCGEWDGPTGSRSEGK